MFTESGIIKIINAILTAITDKTEKLVKNSFILSNIDYLLFASICLSLVMSIFVSNSLTVLALSGVTVFYVLTLVLKKGKEIKLEKSTLFLFLYFVMCLISTINSTMVHASFVGLSKTIIYFLYFGAILHYLKNNKDKITWIAFVIGACVSFETVIAYLQNSFDVLSAATWQDTRALNPEQVLTRVYGTLKPSNPNLLGGYLIAAAPFVWLFTGLSFAEKKKFQTLVGIVFSLAVIPAIFMTGCRGAYIALFVMLLGFLFGIYKICEKHYPTVYEVINRYKNMIIGAGCCFVVAVMMFVPKISHRILSIFAMRNDSSTSFRMNVYNSAIQMFQDNVLFGIGCGNKVFREIYGLYMLSGFDALSAYSVFLEIAVESGIFAAIFYILFVILMIKYAVKSFCKTGNIKDRMVLLSGVVAISGVLVHGFADTVYFRPQIQLIYWSWVAAIYVYSDIEEKIN